MTVDNFVNQHNGQAIDVDGYYGAQCWDLVELYAREVLSVPPEPWAITLGANGSAREAWTVFDSHMQRYFDKHPGNEKQKGDILVYGYNPDGHIAICLGGSSVFQENSPLGSKAHIGNNSDNGLLGVLRTKKGEEMVPDANHLNALLRAFRGREATQDEIDRYVGKVNYSGLVEALDQGSERAATAKALDTGRTALKDDWPGQIYGLKDQVKKLSAEATMLKPGKYVVN